MQFVSKRRLQFQSQIKSLKRLLGLNFSWDTSWLVCCRGTVWNRTVCCRSEFGTELLSEVCTRTHLYVELTLRQDSEQRSSFTTFLSIYQHLSSVIRNCDISISNMGKRSRACDSQTSLKSHRQAGELDVKPHWQTHFNHAPTSFFSQSVFYVQYY